MGTALFLQNLFSKGNIELLITFISDTTQIQMLIETTINCLDFARSNIHVINNMKEKEKPRAEQIRISLFSCIHSSSVKFGDMQANAQPVVPIKVIPVSFKLSGATNPYGHKCGIYLRNLFISSVALNFLVAFFESDHSLRKSGSFGPIGATLFCLRTKTILLYLQYG